MTQTKEMDKHGHPRFKIQDFFYFALFVSLTAINIEIKGEKKQI